MQNESINLEGVGRTQEMPTPLEPFRYPKWVWAILLGAGICFACSAPLIPKLFRSASYLCQGDILRKNGNFDEAAQFYVKILKNYPESTEARVNYAVCVFANKNSGDDKIGLVALERVSLTPAKWRMISEVMPEEYRQYFTTEEE